MLDFEKLGEEIGELAAEIATAQAERVVIERLDKAAGEDVAKLREEITALRKRQANYDAAFFEQKELIEKADLKHVTNTARMAKAASEQTNELIETTLDQIAKASNEMKTAQALQIAARSQAIDLAKREARLEKLCADLPDIMLSVANDNAAKQVDRITEKMEAAVAKRLASNADVIEDLNGAFVSVSRDVLTQQIGIAKVQTAVAKVADKLDGMSATVADEKKKAKAKGKKTDKETEETKEEIEGIKEQIAKMQAESALHGESGQGDLIPTSFTGGWDLDRTYQRGNLTVYLGSTWIATRETTARPGTEFPAGNEEPSWQLFAAAGMGGGFANPALVDAMSDRVTEAPDTFAYVRRGIGERRWVKGERLFEDFKPNEPYWQGEKMFIAEGNTWALWESRSTRTSGPSWDAAEQTHWIRRLGDDPPIIFNTVSPPITREGFWWLNINTWELSVSRTDTGGVIRWVNTGLKGTRPSGTSGGLPIGGTAGMVLTKNSNLDGDASWQNIDAGGY